jgi:hypothetical protein
MRRLKDSINRWRQENTGAVIDHGVVNLGGLSIRAVLWDFMGVKRQITIRRLLAVFMIAGLVLAPLSRPVMAGAASDASASAMAHEMSMSALADEMSMSVTADEMANDIPCCAVVIDCDKCVLMAACMTKCFAGMSAAMVHPLLAVSVRIAPLRNDSWPGNRGHLPPDHPPRIST